MNTYATDAYLTSGYNPSGDETEFYPGCPFSREKIEIPEGIIRILQDAKCYGRERCLSGVAYYLRPDGLKVPIDLSNI